MDAHELLLPQKKAVPQMKNEAHILPLSSPTVRDDRRKILRVNLRIRPGGSDFANSISQINVPGH